MNVEPDNAPETNHPTSDWSGLAVSWVAGAVIPALVGLAMFSHDQSVERKQKEAERAVLGEAVANDIAKRINDGNATDVDLILLGIDEGEYERIHNHPPVKIGDLLEAGNSSTDSR